MFYEKYLINQLMYWLEFVSIWKFVEGDDDLMLQIISLPEV